MSVRDKLFAKRTEAKLTPTTFAGVECFIKAWSEREKIDWAVYCKSISDQGDVSDNFIRCRAIAWSLADESGKLIFNRDEVEAIADFPSDEIERLFNEVIAVQAPQSDAKKN
jgi:hypothetical protein